VQLNAAVLRSLHVSVIPHLRRHIKQKFSVAYGHCSALSKMLPCKLSPAGLRGFDNVLVYLQVYNRQVL